jgi:Ca2+-binding EF-hand superfamily protein
MYMCFEMALVSRSRQALTTWGTKPLTNEEWTLMLKEIGAKEGGTFEYEKLINALYGKAQ